MTSGVPLQRGQRLSNHDLAIVSWTFACLGVASWDSLSPDGACGRTLLISFLHTFQQRQGKISKDLRQRQLLSLSDPSISPPSFSGSFEADRLLHLTFKTENVAG